ncbi:MAG: glycosyltransferase [Alphaproteobacteria bacterium]|nr:glycosyltransferase [Alphaproteobacteria bacterium]
MNIKNPKISVVIPIYNVEDYLPKCLDSLLLQTYDNFEIIAVNDGSTDHCLDILQKYAKRDQRIKIINQKNQGVSAARNAGLDAATGDYVSMPDPDDYLALGCYEKFVNTLRKEHRQIDIYVFNGLAMYVQKTMQKSEISKLSVARHWGGFATSHFKDWRQHQGLIMSDMSICDKIFSRALLEENNLRFLKGMICEDRIFGAEAQLLTKNIYVVEDYMYFCQQRLTSLWHTLGENVFDYLIVSDRMEELYKKHGFYKQAVARHFMYLTHETYRLLPRVKIELAEKFICDVRPRLNNLYRQITDKSALEQKYLNAYQDILNMTAQDFINKYRKIVW